jgi:hypothetical protein
VAETFWDASKALYRTSSGEEIPYRAIRASVEAVVDDTKAKLRALTQARNQGKISIPEWTTQTEPLLKKLYGSVAQIASGGKEQMTAPLNGQLGARTRFQLDKFKGFWLEVERGELSDAAILARMDMYADAAVSVYENLRLSVMTEAGFLEAINILNAENSCNECPAISSRGWIPIEEMTPPGSRTCLSRCRCSVDYR